MTSLLFPLAVAAGLAAPVQFAVNSQLRSYVGGPVAAAAISFLVGTVVLVVAAAPTVGRIHGDRVAGAPWWVWTGGLLGAAYVAASIVLTPRLGAGATVVLFIAGQLLGSIVLDQFGLLRLPVHHATWPRLLGAVLVLGGAVLVQHF
jgi:transporter family-2 protein